MCKKIISFFGSDSKTLNEYKLTSLPLREEYIIEKSIEFFGDPEPCFIHKSAVMKKIYIEMDDYFIGLLNAGRKEIGWDEFPEKYKKALDIQEGIGKVIIR